MERIIDVAAYICREYCNMIGTAIGETKLHKLLYLSQREMLAIIDSPLFGESFEGWIHGPVNTSVRSHFQKGNISVKTRDISDESKYVVNNVLAVYASRSAAELSKLTHSETSWKNARRGLSENENGCELLSLEDIRADAAKVRPYDSVWDMYYDEFETAEDSGQ